MQKIQLCLWHLEFTLWIKDGNPLHFELELHPPLKVTSWTLSPVSRSFPALVVHDNRAQCINTLYIKHYYKTMMREIETKCCHWHIHPPANSRWASCGCGGCLLCLLYGILIKMFYTEEAEKQAYCCCYRGWQRVYHFSGWQLRKQPVFGGVFMLWLENGCNQRGTESSIYSLAFILVLVCWVDNSGSIEIVLVLGSVFNICIF